MTTPRGFIELPDGTVLRGDTVTGIVADDALKLELAIPPRVTVWINRGVCYQCRVKTMAEAVALRDRLKEQLAAALSVPPPAPAAPTPPAAP